MLVTDGDQRAALAVVRSLGRAGHEPFVCESRPRSLAGASRHARRQAVAPDPLAEPEAFRAALTDLVREWRIDVLLPISEAALLAVLPHREAFAGVAIPFPDAARFRRISDKAELLEVARGIGIGVPAQYRVDCRGAADALPAQPIHYPVVVKPTRSVVEAARGGRAKASVVHVADDVALRAVLRALPPESFPVLVQERIVGPGTGVFLLLHEGEVVASFGHRRIREKPPAGGVSVSRESVRPDPELEALSIRLLQAFSWDGVAMVEYKVDARTGAPYLMEVNGRFWGSLQLAIDAGVDFPALLVQLACGDRPAAVRSYRTGVVSRWSWGEVDHLLARLRHSRQALALPPGYPGRARAILDFLRAFGPRSRDEVFRLGDPGPAVREARDRLAGGGALMRRLRWR